LEDIFFKDTAFLKTKKPLHINEMALSLFLLLLLFFV